MISPDEAWTRIAARLAPLAAEQVPRRGAGGRVLAAPLAATVDVPAADVSAMDGFAVAGEVVPGSRWPVVATLAAGDAPGLELAPGQAARIMTGAPLPKGADRVVPVEATEQGAGGFGGAGRPRAARATAGVSGASSPGAASDVSNASNAGNASHAPLASGSETGASGASGSEASGSGASGSETGGSLAGSGAAGTVVLLASVGRGEHVRRRGEVQRAGEEMLAAGSLLTPGALALLATHGHGQLPVHRLPRVAVLATGDEVVSPESNPAPGQLRDSHTDFLLAAGEALGLRFTSLGIAPDRAEGAGGIAERVATGLAAHDVLLICGGVSMGEFDLVEGVLERLGCRRHLDAVAVQPGKPMVFATHPGGLVFGLPGNPAAVMVDFWLFVRPALARLAGRQAAWWHPTVPATLATPLAGADRRDRFLAVAVTWGGAPDGGPLVHAAVPKGSHDIPAYAHGTALLRVRAGTAAVPAGGRCEILPLPPMY